MALVLRYATKFYFYFNDELADPRTQNWVLMRSPFIGLGILGLYLYLVYKGLPKFMSKRPAYDLRTLIAVYNALQVIACGYIVYQSFKLGWARHYSILCQGVDFSDAPEAVDYAYKVCYMYFLVKIADLLDTIFFVLRKKQNQVTFLHVYHHTGVGMLAWAVVKWLPGGHATLLIPLNSFVHMIMYLYYLLTVWDEQYKKSIWWKKHVTQLQLAQFTILTIHFISLLVMPECDYPRFVAYILLPQNLFMVVLFGDFYYKTYIRKSVKKSN